jgi:hypothetical protein
MLLLAVKNNGTLIFSEKIIKTERQNLSNILTTEKKQAILPSKRNVQVGRNNNKHL